MSKLKLNNFPSYIDGINAFEFNEVDMGESSISTSIMLDAKIDPDFKPDWSVEYLGEKFILDSILPSGIKDNSSMRYKYSLIFKSEIQELKKYPFLDMVDLGSGNQLPSVSSFSFQGTLTEFIDRYNLNLKYYVGDKWSMVYDSQDPIPTKSITVSVSNASLWSMLTQIYDLYEVRWIRDGYSIKVGALASEIEHIFEYGKNNGLYSIERVNPNADLYTRLIGVGGSTNMPESYFKLNDPDTNNIIKTMYFSGIVPKQYRDYIRGWNAGVVNQSENDAYNKGAQDKLDGKRMQPIDYAEDNIDKWGVRYGTIQANDEIFPTIQGAEREGLGRIDEIIDVEAVTNDDWQATEEGKGSIQTVKNATSSVVIPDQQYKELYVYSDSFHVTDKDSFIRLVFTTYPTILDGTQPNGLADRMKSTRQIRVLDMSGNEVYRSQNLTSNTHTIYSLPSGMYKLEGYTNTRYTGGFGDEAVLTIEMSSIKVHNPNDSTAFSDYYNVWIKDIGFDLRNQSYWTSKRMVLMYSDGMLAGEDYEFELVAEELEDGSLKPYIYEDDSREHNGIKSKYRITLKKSDAELEATGKYLPNMMQNAKAGDHFFLINIALPHEYVLDAERRVSNWLQEEVAKTSDEAPTFSIKASSIFMADFAESDLMRAGTKLRVRDSRLIGDSYLPLYIQSQTISHKENKILPDYTIIVSDDIIATKNPIELLQSSVARLSSGTLSKQQVSEISRQFERFFLRKDGISDVSYSPTHFKDDVTHTGVVKSDDFRQGDLSGAGFAMYRDEAGASVIEADKIVGRREFRTNEIKVNQVTFFGGKQIFSAAGMTCSNVEELTDGWKCYFDTKMGTVRNLFKIGDQAYHQTTSPDGSVVTNYFWRLITELGSDYIVISKTLGDGSGYPVAGNDIAQLGHPTDKSRQSALEIDMTRSGGGLVTWFDNINTFNLVEKDSVSIGKINGEVWAQVYGNAYIGERDQSTYLRHYNGVTEFKGRAEFTSGQAKEDIDKALQDAEDAKNIQIGGVNLFSGTANYSQKYWDDVVALPELLDGNKIASITGMYPKTPSTQMTTQGVSVLPIGKNRVVSALFKGTRDGQSVGVTISSIKGTNWHPQKVKNGEWSKLTWVIDGDGSSVVVFRFEGNMSSDTYPIYVSSIQLEEGNKSTSWSPSPQDVESGINNAQNSANSAQQSANDASDSIEDLNTYVDGAFKDGIITQTEAQSIASLINTVNESFSSLSGAYSILYANEYLEGSAKTNLRAEYDNVVASKNNLTNSINSAIEDGKTTTAERDDVNNKYNIYNSSINSYYSSVEVANSHIQTKIDELSTDKVDNIQIGGRNLFIDSANFGSTYWKERSYTLLLDEKYKGCRIYKTPLAWAAKIYNNYDNIDLTKEHTFSLYIKSDIDLSAYNGDVISYGIAPNKTIMPINKITSRWQRVSITGLLNGDINGIRPELSIAITGGYVYFCGFKLEEGNKATDWSPAPEDIENGIDSKAQTFRTQPVPPYRVGDLWLSSSGVFQCVVSRASGSFTKSDWSLTDLHDNTKTVIDGGVVTSGTIRLAGDDYAIKAGITGNGTADSSVRVWAGATEANKNNAPFIVRQDGSMKATKASIEGSITATKGYIGGFEIGYNRIGATSSSNSTTGEGLSIYDNFIKFSDSDTWASIGTNVLPGTTGATGVGRFSNTESNSNGTNYGLLVSVRNATNNLAIVTSGDIVANGAINSYVYSTITPAYNTVHIPGELTSPTMFNIIAKFTNKDSGIGLLTRSSIVSKLNISYSTPFAVKMTIICSADSTETGFVIGRNTIIGNMDNNQYPYRLNNDATVQTGKMNLAKGDVVEFMLVWDNVNYRAYELNHKS